jgi:hypothetical protein
MTDDGADPEGQADGDREGLSVADIRSLLERRYPYLSGGARGSLGT